jgi:phosphonate transport system substrate-binding protein
VMRATLTRAAAALMVAASTFAASAQTPTEINFGVISTEASMNQKKNWEPFLQAMSKATGFKVNGFYATDYAGVIEAMRFNKIHLAWYGNKSAMEAVDRASGEVFAHIVARDGSVGYYSHVIVHKDSPFTKIEDILKCDKSLDFGIGDPNSTSGFLVPTAYVFAARNLDPKTCFKTVRNANHQANAMAVANKQVAAATNNSEDLQRVAASAPDARSPASFRSEVNTCSSRVANRDEWGNLRRSDSKEQTKDITGCPDAVSAARSRSSAACSSGEPVWAISAYNRCSANERRAP